MGHSRMQRDGEMSLLENNSLSVYEWALRNGTLRAGSTAAADLGLTDEELAQARADLLDLGLLLPAGDGTGEIPADPAIAEMMVGAPLEQEIEQRQQALIRVHEQLRPLSPSSPSTRSPGGRARGSVPSTNPPLCSASCR